MPKSFNHLWSQVVSWDNLVRSYHRCRRRKRFKPEAIAFDFEWEANLVELQRDLQHETYAPGANRHFHILEPKPRKISAAPFVDRVVHHAIVGVLEPIFERRFIHDSYACRPRKGTHRALNRAQEYLKRYRYFLKTDIVKFFPNVDHEVLMSTLARTIRDRDLMKLIAVIVSSGDGVLREERGPVWFPGDDLFSPLRPCGLPIGNLTSQFFANVLLDRVDHFLKEDIQIPGYVRYADDLLLFDDCKTRLWDVRDALVAKLANLRLRLHPHKTQVAPSRRGVGFLGFHITARARRLKQSALRRLNRRLRQLRWQFSKDLLDCPDFRVSVQRGWLMHPVSKVWKRLHEYCGVRSFVVPDLVQRRSNRLGGTPRRQCHPADDLAESPAIIASRIECVLAVRATVDRNWTCSIDTRESRSEAGGSRLSCTNRASRRALLIQFQHSQP